MKMAVNIVKIVAGKVFSTDTVLGEVRTSTYAGRKNVANQDDMEKLGKRAEQVLIEKIYAEGSVFSQEKLEEICEDGYVRLNGGDCELLINWATSIVEVTS
jgi:hypothetical protein